MSKFPSKWTEAGRRIKYFLRSFVRRDHRQLQIKFGLSYPDTFYILIAFMPSPLQRTLRQVCIPTYPYMCMHLPAFVCVCVQNFVRSKTRIGYQVEISLEKRSWKQWFYKLTGLSLLGCESAVYYLRSVFEFATCFLILFSAILLTRYSWN